MTPIALAVTIAFAALPGERLPLTRLTPARLHAGVCTYHYPVGTVDDACQKHCDLGAGFYQNYVYLEAVRHYETATRLDPDCAMAWLGLAVSLQKWSPPRPPAAQLALSPLTVTAKPADAALANAKRASATAGFAVQLLVRARLEELGRADDSGTSKSEWRRRAAATLDELLTVHDDDQEAWYARAALAEGQYGKIPFYKALLKVNPLHPGANHELVHAYENVRRPALGWPYAKKYMESSPGVPHAFHMQAHLAMRIGEWADTTDWSVQAAELQHRYHRDAGVNPRHDEQFRHHLDILSKALVHDGRFRERDKLRAEASRVGHRFTSDDFRAAILREDWADAEAVVAALRRTDKPTAAYLGALLALEQGDLKRAEAEADTLRASQKSGKARELRNFEVRGRLLAARGEAEAGLKLLKRAVTKTSEDYAHEAWGGGAYYYEVWGRTALAAGLVDEAEEGFLEALAHDHGSVHAALGLQVLCRRQGRDAEASAYARLANRAWRKADPADLGRLRARYERLGESAVSRATGVGS